MNGIGLNIERFVTKIFSYITPIRIMPKTISKNGIELIKYFEGFRSCPYKDVAGVPTIGYGNTYYVNGEKVRMSDTCITKEKSSAMLLEVVKDFEGIVRDAVTTELTQNQFDALVSFTYNLGGGALRSSTLLKKVNRNPKDKSIRYEFSRWVYADGEKLDGLVTRRKAEADLYFT